MHTGISELYERNKGYFISRIECYIVSLIKSDITEYSKNDIYADAFSTTLILIAETYSDKMPS